MLRGEGKDISVDWESNQASWRRGFECVAFGEAKERVF